MYLGPTTSNTKCFTNGIDNKMLYPEQFDEYIQKHPDATNEEVYEALSGIRESVTRRHHEHGDDGQED